MKSVTLFLTAVVAVILSDYIFASEMSGVGKFLLIWLVLSVPGALLFARIFPRRGR